MGENIALAIPTYGEQMWIRTHRSIMDVERDPPPGRKVYDFMADSSGLTWTFNTLWARCLNERDEKDLKWMVMLHADMASPDPEWLTKLVGMAEKHNLFALGAAASLKCPGNLTNAAVRDRAGVLHRIGWDKLQAGPEVVLGTDFPSDTKLLINTGMLAIRVDQPLSEMLCFGVENAIFKGEDGTWRADFFAEDWRMSQWLSDAGAPYGVTGQILTLHHGSHDYGAGGG